MIFNQYYPLKTPITHVRLTPMNSRHNQLSMWINHQFAGSVTLSGEDEIKDFLEAIRSPFSSAAVMIDDSNEAMKSVLAEYVALENNTCLIGANGTIATVAELREANIQ